MCPEAQAVANLTTSPEVSGSSPASMPVSLELRLSTCFDSPTFDHILAPVSPAQHMCMPCSARLKELTEGESPAGFQGKRERLASTNAQRNIVRPWLGKCLSSVKPVTHCASREFSSTLLQNAVAGEPQGRSGVQERLRQQVEEMKAEEANCDPSAALAMAMFDHPEVSASNSALTGGSLQIRQKGGTCG